jgi:hypothetical protein
MTKKRENGRTDSGRKKKDRMKNRQRNTTDVERRSGNTFGVRNANNIKKSFNRRCQRASWSLYSTAPVVKAARKRLASPPKSCYSRRSYNTHPSGSGTHTQHTRRRSQKHPLPTHSCVLCASTHVPPPTTSTTPRTKRRKIK